MLTVHVFGALMVLSSSVLAQAPSLLWETTGLQTNEGFARSLTNVGDVDGDGGGDVCISAPNHVNTPNSRGRVDMHSGATGAPIWTAVGPDLDFGFGHAVAGVGDADGDGVGDVFVSSPFYPLGMEYGAVRMLSGVDGQELWSRSALSLPTGFSAGNFGLVLGAIGDVNGDGYSDCWAGHYGNNPTWYVFDGRDGAILRTLPLGVRKVCVVPDRDNDGIDEYCFGQPYARASAAPQPLVGRITVESGRSGVPLLTVEGEVAPVISSTNDTTVFGWDVACFGDYDGDGVDDIAVGNPWWKWGFNTVGNLGRTQVISGATGAALLTLGGLAYRLHGEQVLQVGDLTGDGYGDFVTYAASGPPQYVSGAQVIDGRAGLIVQSIESNSSWGIYRLAAADMNGDGKADLLSGVEQSFALGDAYAIDLGFPGVRPLARIRNAGCETSLATMPRIRYRGLPKLGTTFTIEARSMVPSQICMLGLGQAQSVDLGPIGAPDCTAWVNPGFQMWGVLSQYGHRRIDFPIPSAPALQGFALTGQWLGLDPAANALGVVVSDALDLELQL